MDLHPDLIDLLTEFANSGVEYLIVGGAKRAANRPKDRDDLKALDRFRKR